MLLCSTKHRGKYPAQWAQLLIHIEINCQSKLPSVSKFNFVGVQWKTNTSKH